MKNHLNFISLIAIILVSSLVNAQEPGAGTCYDFASNTMVAPNDASLNPTYISIEAWIKADSWGANSWENVIVSKDGWASGPEGYTLRTGANGTLSFNFGSGGVWTEVLSAPTMLTGKWYHVAGTFDGATLRIYINGVEVGTTAYVGTIANGAYNLTIGGAAYTVGGTRNFDGNIDEIRMWNTAISNAEIQDYMCKKIDASHPSYASLIAHYNYDNPGYFLDGSTNGNDLTNLGATQVTSGAAIGDASIHQYGGPYDLSLGYPAVDSINVQSTNSISTIHLYRVDMAPNTINTGGSMDSLDYSHYYGVFVGSSAAYNYTLDYNYHGNPLAIGNPTYVDLAGRTNATVTSWAPQGGTVSVPTTTITKTLNDRSEVMIGIVCPHINLDLSGTINACQGDTITVTDLGTNSTYQWYDGSGPLAGETSNTIDLFYTEDFYLVANDAACTDTSAIVNLLVFPTPTVTFGPFPSPGVCEDYPDVPLSGGSPLGGTYSGAGVVGTNFEPATAGPGAHWVTYTYTDMYSCTNSDSLLFNVFPNPPTPTITLNGDTMCVNSTDTIGIVYEWFLNGTSVSLGPDSCYIALANGNYQVVASSIFSCFSDTSAIQVIDFVNLNEQMLSSSFSIAPNPTTNFVEVRFANNAMNEAKVQLKDAQGRILSTQVTNQNQVNVDLENNASGIYFISISLKGDKAVKRVLKF